MFRKVFNLFKILRKLSGSGVINTIDNIKPVPGFLKFIIYLFSIGSEKEIYNQSKSTGEKLCNSLESMGPTFIKLGQFLATRPDIIGEAIATSLEKLQDKLPAFNTTLFFDKEDNDSEVTNFFPLFVKTTFTEQCFF